MFAFTTLTNKGTPVGEKPTLSMFLYPNTLDVVDECRTQIKRALTDFGDLVYNGTAVQYYEVLLHTGPVGIPIEGDTHTERRDDFWESFWSWVEDRGYLDYRGVHLGVDGSFSGGVALGGDGGTSAFTTGQPGVFGTDATAEYYRNSAIHESGHNCVDSRLPTVDELIEHEGNEHELGRIYRTGAASPMVSGDDRQTSTRGNCHSDVTYRSHTTAVTRCTVDAIAATIESEF